MSGCVEQYFTVEDIFFKIGENTIVLVREFVPKVSYKYHFCDSVKLIFSNSPVITFANVSANVKEASVSFDIGLYNSRNTALLTDVSVTIYDKNMNAKGSYVIENVDVNHE